MRTIRVLGAGIVAACALGIAAVTVADTPPSIARISGYSLPTEIVDGRIALAPLSTQPGISADQALSIAEGYAKGLASNPTGVSIQAVLFTDHVRGTENADG